MADRHCRLPTRRGGPNHHQKARGFTDRRRARLFDDADPKRRGICGERKDVFVLGSGINETTPCKRRSKPPATRFSSGPSGIRRIFASLRRREVALSAVVILLVIHGEDDGSLVPSLRRRGGSL